MCAHTVAGATDITAPEFAILDLFVLLQFTSTLCRADSQDGDWWKHPALHSVKE
jgi:hypothetical protein